MVVKKDTKDKLLYFFHSLSQCYNINDVASTIIHLANVTKELLSADRCSIFLYDKDRDELYTYYAHGVDEIRVPSDKGIVGACFKSGDIINIPDAYKDPRFNPEVDRKTGYRTRNILAVPLKGRMYDILGVFQVINKLDRESFTDEDVSFLQNIALYSASLLEGALLFDKLKETQKEVIIRLSHATKYKDKETRNHIVRVGLFAEVVAKGLGWDEKEVELIKLAAPMHDIGKVGVPDRILQKPGKLTDEEWDIMKKHTVFGYEILKDSDSELLQVASLVALEHHEKWDGSGYPYGKKEYNISPYGRITALVDVFDALTSHRPYKRAWSIEEACDEINKLKGKFFDPDMVDAFLENIDKIKDIKEKYKDEDVEENELK